MKLDSRKVSWLSFLVMAIAAIALGLVGNQLIVKSLQNEFIAHGIAHNQEVAVNLLPLLQTPLRRGITPREVVSRFQDSLIRPQHRPDGYAVFLVDLQQGAVLASLVHSDPSLVTDGTRYAEEWIMDLINNQMIELQTDSVLIQSIPVQDRLTLTSFNRVTDMGLPEDTQWLLVVRTDITELMETMHELHTRFSGTLLLSVAIVAVGGVMVLRRLGRAYESYLEDKLRERTEQLETAHAEIVSKARLVTLGQTASTLAHEIRNPLASIKLGLSGLVSSTDLDPRRRRRLDIVLREVSRLDDMLSDALNFVRPIRLSSEPIALDRLLDNVLQVLKPSIKERGLILNRHDCPRCPALRMDTAQMEQALLNLLKNAIEASPRGEAIEVSITDQPNAVYFEVVNHGPAIPADQQTKLFEPFFTTKPSGTGLGLVLVKRVVEEHGGEIYFLSTSESGTHFGFQLFSGGNITNVPDEATQEQEAASLSAIGQNLNGGRRKRQ